ncbi:MAG: hypothetical protein R2716_08525 [Microthrixaceae bacterium]
MTEADHPGQAPIHDVVRRWHRHLRGDLPGGLDELLADDCVFVSPIVFRPQQGKELTKLYLEAASQTLPGDSSGSALGERSPDGAPGAGAPVRDDPDWDGRFRYTKEVLSGHHAVLEFETTVEGTYVNGVDIITCDDGARITEFRVMIRPLRGQPGARPDEGDARVDGCPRPLTAPSRPPARWSADA